MVIGVVLYAVAAMAGPDPDPVAAEPLANESVEVSHQAAESKQGEESHATYLPYY
jgi:hypothetical protein